MLGPHIYPPRADGGDVRQCPTCGTGRLNLKAGKFGAFVGCSNYPECRYTRPLAADGEASADRVLGKDPETDLDVTVKAGRFGPYIQLGEQKDYAEGEKPRRAGLPKNTSPGDMDKIYQAKHSSSRMPFIPVNCRLVILKNSGLPRAIH